MTSQQPSPPTRLPEKSQSLRPPLRLALSPTPGAGPIDGGWWPHSRELQTELADLVDHFPAVAGRVYRALYSRPDWSTQPRAISTGRGRMKVGSFPRDDTQLIVLSLSTRSLLRLAVIPPDHPDGTEALARSSAATNTSTAAQILSTPTLGEESDASDHWHDAGGNWWRSGTAPPSLR